MTVTFRGGPGLGPVDGGSVEGDSGDDDLIISLLSLLATWLLIFEANEFWISLDSENVQPVLFLFYHQIYIHNNHLEFIMNPLTAWERNKLLEIRGEKVRKKFDKIEKF